jgi:O-glycosyl hydrolase
MDSGGKLSGSESTASSYNAKVIGSVWTAPASCKDNNNEQKGGHVLASCYGTHGRMTIAKFAKRQ